MLRQQSLTSYYDEVALKGLQLAANDAKRGVLNTNQLDRIKSTIKTMVHGLRDHDDSAPPAKPDAGMTCEPDDGDVPVQEPAAPPAGATGWSHGHSILCIAGRGPLAACRVGAFRL